MSPFWTPIRVALCTAYFAAVCVLLLVYGGVL